MNILNSSWQNLDPYVKGCFSYKQVEKKLCDAVTIKLTAGKAPELAEFFKTGTLYSFEINIDKDTINTWKFTCGRIKLILEFKVHKYKESNSHIRELQEINLTINN
jgi:hypothetical protein